MATELNLLDYGAVADSNYYNDANDEWYVDENFTTLSTDNTDSFRYALADAPNYSQTIIKMPNGGLKFLGTLWVPSNTTFKGGGMGVTFLYLGKGSTLDNTIFRDIERVEPLICTIAGSGQITFRDFTLHGDNFVHYDYIWGLAGILAKETEQIKFINVDVSRINLSNINAENEWGYNGWGMTSLDCNDIEFLQCRGEYSGYQNFGFFDRSTNGLMTGCFSGMGRRTSTQVHRDTNNILISKNTIINPVNSANDTQLPHAALTVHGEEGFEARNLTIDDNYIEMVGGFKAAIQAFRQSEGLVVTHNRIKSNAEGVHLGDADGAKVNYNKISSNGNVTSWALDAGNIGLNVVNYTKNSELKFNEVIGFDTPLNQDSNSMNNVTISDNEYRNFLVRQAKLFKNDNGRIVEVKPTKNVNGFSRKVVPFVKW